MEAHSAFLLQLGVSGETVAKLKGDWRSAGLAEKTRVMLDYAVEVTRDATRIGDPAFARLRKAGCSDEEILEATVVAAFFNFMDRVADALGVEVDRWKSS
ncbi:MAG: carboxymuconolactone decarboxylase family protein [Planctomycetes bacterium]|nr:carboxymuconolactone decarboxylase family protein [Planctomycetota bacterium]